MSEAWSKDFHVELRCSHLMSFPSRPLGGKGKEVANQPDAVAIGVSLLIREPQFFHLRRGAVITGVELDSKHRAASVLNPLDGAVVAGGDAAESRWELGDVILMGANKPPVCDTPE